MIVESTALVEHRWRLGPGAHGPQNRRTVGGAAPLGISPLRALGLQRELHGADSIDELFTRGADRAAAECGFSRALVLTVQGRMLKAGFMGALEDPASDTLRRRIQSEPVVAGPGTVEAAFLRLVKGGRGEVVEGWSALQEQHGIEHFALGAIVPEDEVLALLVVDRPGPAVEPAERATVQVFAQLFACALERVIRRQRAREVSSELQYVATSAYALLTEGATGPVSLAEQPAHDSGYGLALAGLSVPAACAHTAEALKEVLTPREWSIAKGVVTGRTNREIAEALQLSPATVKNYASRILHKLGAANRAEAAAAYGRLLDSTA